MSSRRCDRCGRTLHQGPRPHSAFAQVDELLAAAGRGDATAFGILYDSTISPIFGYLYRSLGDQDAAAAAAERIYLRLWRSAPQFCAHECAFALMLAGVRRELRRARDRVKAPPGRTGGAFGSCG